MRLSLTVRIQDRGQGNSEVRVSVDGQDAVGLVPHNELWMHPHVLFFEKPGPGLQPSVARRRAAVNLQERKRAEELGGRRQTGSGAVRGIKSDGRVPGKCRIENKSTVRRSFRVELDDLRKIRSECQGMEFPIFEVEFQKPKTFEVIEKWAVIPWEELRKYLELSAATDA